MNWHDYFEYNDGALIRKLRFNRRMNTRYAGLKVGYLNKSCGGYLVVKIGKKPMLVHRIIWEMHHGPIPDGLVIDHIDGDQCNNRIDNLRTATRGQNIQNSKISKSNKSGYKGVCFRADKMTYSANIQANGKKYHLGTFPTVEMAADAYNKASISFHGEFRRQRLSPKP